MRQARHVGAPRAVDRDPVSLIDADAAAKVGGVDERGAGRVQLRHERVAVAAIAHVEGARGRREVRGRGKARDVRAAGAVDRDRLPLLIERSATEEGRIDEAWVDH